MSIYHGTLNLEAPTKSHGLRMPIDSFFRSLAEDQGEMAICIILSGTGTDGTLGHDFSFYKKTTLNQRIEKRLNLHNIDDIPLICVTFRGTRKKSISSSKEEVWSTLPWPRAHINERRGGCRGESRRDPGMAGLCCSVQLSRREKGTGIVSFL